MKTEKEIDEIMGKLYPSWRWRWCEAQVCACMGCTNGSGQADITKEEWEAWVERNRRPSKDEI